MTTKITTIEDVPIIDFNDYIGKDAEAPAVKAVCKQVAESLHNYGILIVRDPRAQQKDNSEYIDLMEKFFESRGKQLYAGEKVEEFKPEYHYQVGACPENQEIARNHAERIQAYPDEHKPVSPLEPKFDAKWRYMWKIGERPAEALDNFPQVIPKDFPEWEGKMDNWGHKLLDAVYTVSEMAAIGMGVAKDTFTKRLEGGAHLLAPTGSDLVKNDVGAIFAGFHYDIAYLTIHGKSRFPGLYAWLRNDQKLQVKVPDGCLLLQSGKLFEHITGGYVLAGFHEVIYTEATKEAKQKAEAEGRSTWRVSSTMFTHSKYDLSCAPMKELEHLWGPMHAENKELGQKYPEMTSFDILMEELNATNMVIE